jgi:hypothetical protein
MNEFTLDYRNLVYAESRIITVSRWRKRNSDYHLRCVYYINEVGNDKGFHNFFNENLDVMDYPQARKYLNWKAPKEIKRPYITRKQRMAGYTEEAHEAQNKYLSLRVYPSSKFYYAVGNSQQERESVFRDAIRQSMIRLITETKIPLKWVAAVNASASYMVGIIIIPKTIFDGETNQSVVVKNCFPPSFFSRGKPTAAENTNHIEKMIATALFDCAAQTKDFENRIDDLIEISRKYKFELPISYYALRYLDGEGNLITEREKMRLSFNKRYEQFALERTSPAKS